MPSLLTWICWIVSLFVVWHNRLIGLFTFDLIWSRGIVHWLQPNCRCTVPDSRSDGSRTSSDHNPLELLFEPRSHIEPRPAAVLLQSRALICTHIFCDFRQPQRIHHHRCSNPLWTTTIVLVGVLNQRESKRKRKELVVLGIFFFIFFGPYWLQLHLGQVYLEIGLLSIIYSLCIESNGRPNSSDQWWLVQNSWTFFLSSTYKMFSLRFGMTLKKSIFQVYWLS